MSAVRELAIIGAGPMAMLSTSLASAAGHRIGIWDPRGDTSGHQRIKCTGALESESLVEFLPSLSEVAQSPTVLIAIPGTAYHPVLAALLSHLRDGQCIIFSGALSLAQLWLRERALQHGVDIAIATWGTTLGTAQRIAPLHAHVTTVRPSLAVTAVPADRSAELTALCQDLFGPRFQSVNSALATVLSNINPIAHAGQVIPNLSRIEKGEKWSLFANFTEAGANIATAIDRERLAIAEAFGIQLRSLADHYRLSFDVAGTDVAGIAQEIEKAGKTMPGPETISHRYIAEDVPFGLVPLQRLGAVVSVPTPILDLSVDLLSCALNQPYRAMNPVLDELDITRERKDTLLRRLQR